MSNSLAIFGGQPVRERAFRLDPLVDEEEERMVLQAVRDLNFSRYVGSPYPNVEVELLMTSAEAMEIEADWNFLGGPNVRAFAAEFAARMDVPYAIPVNSATSGISVALGAAGVGPGDEVIVPGISFTATASATLLFNSIPIFVDVDPLTFCLDPAAVEAAITPRTKAILPVHLTGNLANMDAIMAIARKHKLKVIEDAAQAIGAEWGTQSAGAVGDAGVFSFQQSKNIMTGEGGMIITSDPELARAARLIINHGESVFDETHVADDLVNMVGFNFRMPELCAAVGRAQLAKLNKVNDLRTVNADLLRSGFANLPGIKLPPSQRADNGPARDVPHLFVALHDAKEMGLSRDLFVKALAAEGIPAGTGYVRPMYANPVFLNKVAYGRGGCPWTCHGEDQHQVYEPGMCPNAERLLYEQFLWFYHIGNPSTAEDMADVVAGVQKVVAQRHELAARSDEIAFEGPVRMQGRTELTRK
jgi:perosamine synthetase